MKKKRIPRKLKKRLSVLGRGKTGAAALRKWIMRVEDYEPRSAPTVQRIFDEWKQK